MCLREAALQCFGFFVFFFFLSFSILEDKAWELDGHLYKKKTHGFQENGLSGFCFVLFFSHQLWTEAHFSPIISSESRSLNLETSAPLFMEKKKNKCVLGVVQGIRTLGAEQDLVGGSRLLLCSENHSGFHLSQYREFVEEPRKL